MKKIVLLTLVACMAMGISSVYADIDNMDIGGDLMAEYFYSNDLVSNKSETDFLRTEGHLWFQADLDDNVMARISLEFDRALDSSMGSARNDLAASSFGGFDNLDLFLEEAFVKVADIAGTGITVSVGRQFLNFGDDPNADNFNRWWGPGFVISDSDPMSPSSIAQLGSYEIDPFDAIVVSYEMEDFAVSGIYARSSEDFSNTINDDSAVTALYGSYYGFEGHQVDLYLGWADNNIGSSDTYVVGGRASGDITPDFAYKAEVAYQFMTNNLGPEVEGLAIQAGINYHPEFEYNPNVGLIYTFLEGDQGDGVRFMDGKTYGLLADSFAFGQLTNAHVFNLNGGFEPMESVAWTADLYYILMDDDIIIGTSKEDEGGFEVDSQIDYKFNDNLTTFLGGGVYFIGDAYGRDDEAYFFRTGLKVAF